MPFYEFRCGNCGVIAQERRRFDAMDSPGPAHCGHPAERIFSPTSAIFVPRKFHTTWSDIHDVTERELAKQYPDIEPANRVASRPSGRAAREKTEFQELETAFVEATAKTDAIYSARGWDKDA